MSDTEALVGCAAVGTTVVACQDVVARLSAAERDERELGIDTSELRHHAERIAHIHLVELEARR
jgi:hypothetical protein